MCALWCSTLMIFALSVFSSISKACAIVFFILLGYRTHGRAPILARDQEILNIVDPLPQAMVLTTIVIGLALTVVVVSLALRIYEKYGTFDITKIRRLRG